MLNKDTVLVLKHCFFSVVIKVLFKDNFKSMFWNEHNVNN